MNVPTRSDEPTLFGFPLNKIVAFVGPYVAVLAGAVADWLLVHVHLLGLFHTTHNQIASAITQVVVFGLTAALVWLGHQKWLEGYQKWAYPIVHAAPVLQVAPLAPPTLLEASIDDGPGDELPPEAEGIAAADPNSIPPDEGNAVAGDLPYDETDLHGPSELGPLGASASGLSTTHRIRARDLAVAAAFLGLHNAPVIHYSQNATARWEGISGRLKAWRRAFPRNADCSAFVTWCLWNGLSHYGVRDVVNGQNWRAGYTGTMVSRGKRVVHEANIMRGDLALYGDPFGGSGHVAVCVGGGMVISHGSESGPHFLPLHYRSDLREVRRYI